jgi:hypothetical protein
MRQSLAPHDQRCQNACTDFRYMYNHRANQRSHHIAQRLLVSCALLCFQRFWTPSVPHYVITTSGVFELLLDCSENRLNCGNTSRGISELCRCSSQPLRFVEPALQVCNASLKRSPALACAFRRLHDFHSSLSCEHVVHHASLQFSIAVDAADDVAQYHLRGGKPCSVSKWESSLFCTQLRKICALSRTSAVHVLRH